MTFLAPLILAALPLMALPILIHLINQRRYRSVNWGATMFLINAQQMNKGMARLRHFLILLMRALAVGALIFAISRPLASGWMSGVGMGKPDATLILLDRSASMEAQDLQTGQSKRSTALAKLTELLEKRGYGSQLILIDSVRGEPRAIDSPRALLNLPGTTATATSANIPGMLQTALTYLEANESGRADLWICSDLHENDWDPRSGRWAALREQFRELQGVHHFLLSYADPPASNLSVRIANVERRQSGNQAELVLDVSVRVEGEESSSIDTTRSVPIEFEVNGVRSLLDVELDSAGASLQGHRLPIDGRLRSGWGSARLPGDTNPQDNRFYFAFSEPPVRKTIIISDDAKTGEALRRALAIPIDPRVQHDASVLPSVRMGEIDWENTALLIWHAPLPTGLMAEQVERFVDRGRVALFLPPPREDSAELFGSRWGKWQQADGEQGKISWWRGDADLLAHVDSGEALPLNEIRTYRYRTVESNGTPLARLENESPLLTRVSTDRGAVYFCSTLPTAQYSSLAREGVVFYVMLQRALAVGSRSLRSASGRDAGPDVLADREQWETVAPAGDVPGVSERGLHAGVFRNADYWAAVNRSLDEDSAEVAAGASVDALFEGLSYRRIDDAIGDNTSLASEIWRAFLIGMLLALVLEAVLCLPERTGLPEKTGPTTRTAEQNRSSGFAMTGGAVTGSKQEAL